MTNAVKDDCVHFRGDKPCRFKRFCEGCPHFDPFAGRTKVLVLKCRAQGDVLRTTALLAGIKRKYPKSFLTWLTDEESVNLLESVFRKDFGPKVRQIWMQVGFVIFVFLVAFVILNDIVKRLPHGWGSLLPF